MTPQSNLPPVPNPTPGPVDPSDPLGPPIPPISEPEPDDPTDVPPLPNPDEQNPPMLALAR
jgi:hypothetical protein